MIRVKEIAKELSKGNFKKASQLGRELSKVDASFDAEIMEIARQAMIVSLKTGKISAAKEIKKAFAIPEEVVDETVQQAVMSSVYEGDMVHVKMLKKDLPIRKELSEKIVGYCATWGKKDRSTALEQLFA